VGGATSPGLEDLWIFMIAARIGIRFNGLRLSRNVCIAIERKFKPRRSMEQCENRRAFSAN
jgi:hypothetical protein